MPVRVWALALVVALGIGPIGPPEHVHETTDADGHHVLVAHRHVQLHTVDTHHSGPRDTVDHPDPVAFVLDAPYTAATRYVLHVPAFVAVAMVAVPPVRTAAAAIRFSERLIHAPPRAPSSLRAPPAGRYL